MADFNLDDLNTNLPRLLARFEAQIANLTETLERFNQRLEVEYDRQRQDIAANRSDIADLTERMQTIDVTVSEVIAWTKSHDTYACPFVMGNDNAIRMALRQKMLRHFGLDDLDTLAVDAGINPEEIGGDTLTNRVANLIEYMYKLNRLSDLVRVCQRMRPNVMWPFVLHEFHF